MSDQLAVISNQPGTIYRKGGDGRKGNTHLGFFALQKTAVAGSFKLTADSC